MAVQLTAFFLVVAHYFFSGIANGGGYAKRNVVQYIGIAWQVAITGLALSFVPLSFVNISLCVLSVSCFVLNKLKFDGNLRVGDIHLYTYLGSAFFCLLVCYDLSIFGLLGVYAGLLLEKGMINLGSKLTFFDNRTDDASGDTFGIPSLGIKVPRLKSAYRIPLAVLSLVAIGFISMRNWNLTIHWLLTNFVY